MGQDWYIINLDKGEYISYGKLSENICCGSFGELLALLTRPSAILPLDLEDVKNTMKRFNEKNSDWIVARRSSRKSDAVCKYAQPFSTLGVLSKIPNEVILMIMAELSSFKDIISLGLTSTSFLALAHHNVQRRYVKDIPRWRGDRIACIGDWMCQSDLLGLFTEEELAAFDGCQYPEYRDSEVDVCAIIYRSGAFKEARIHRKGTVFTEEYDKPVSKWKVLDELGINSMGCCVEIILIDHLVEPTLSYDVGMEWVLCNLSKKEYVYADDIAKAIDQSPHGPFFGNNLTFPEVLVPHICMEAGHSSPLRVEDKDDVRKGPWTGDRFDITTVDKVDLAEWRDVTDEVMDNINRIWELVWGENWKKNA